MNQKRKLSKPEITRLVFERGRKRRISRRWALRAKLKDQLFVSERLLAMNLPKFVKKVYPKLRKGLSPSEAKEMLRYYLTRHIVSFMDLPASKKKIVKRLAMDPAILEKFHLINRIAGTKNARLLKTAMEIVFPTSQKPENMGFRWN